MVISKRLIFLEESVHAQLAYIEFLLWLQALTGVWRILEKSDQRAHSVMMSFIMVQKKAKKKATLQTTEQARIYTLFSFLEGKRFSWNVQRNEKNVTDFARFLHAHSQDNQAMSTSFWPSPQDNSSTQLVYVNFLLFCQFFSRLIAVPRGKTYTYFFLKRSTNGLFSWVHKRSRMLVN